MTNGTPYGLVNLTDMRTRQPLSTGPQNRMYTWSVPFGTGHFLGSFWALYWHPVDKAVTKHRQIQIGPISSLPNRVQNIPPRTGSGKEANRAVNFPIVPNKNIMPAPYCITLLLPTCRRNQDTRETTACHKMSDETENREAEETTGELWIVYLHLISASVSEPKSSHYLTFVMPSTPMLGLEEVDPFPVPSSPAMIQHTPSVKIPLEKKNINHVFLIHKP